MHGMIKWFIRNPVAANLIMLLILIGGALTIWSMRIEGFPKLPADAIHIETTFAGAYAEQIDRQITQKIEDALEGTPGVQKIQSASLESYSSIRVQKKGGYDLERLLDDVRIRLDGIYNLPRQAEKPVISRNDFDFPALIVQLYGDVDADTLQRLGRQIRKELLALPEVSRLNVWGERQPEIRIEVHPEILEQYNLTIDDIVARIQQSSLTYKAGSLKTKGGQIALRADNQAYHYRDFAEMVVYERNDGSRLQLKDVAEVLDDYVINDSIVRFNGQAALGMEVLIGRKENLLDIAEAIKETVEELQVTLPPEVTLSVWADSSHYIAERLKLLKNNALQGLVLVFVLLALFLNFKLAFWVALGIPISVAGAMAVMGSRWVDYSLNDITTFGLIIALGILVDDAVVVGESIFQERRKYKNNSLLGTEKGVNRVAVATVYGVLTTVAAFFPMMLIDNALGKMLASFSGVVIMALLFSLFESKFILPAHLAHVSLKENKSSFSLFRYWRHIQSFAQDKLEAFNLRLYQPALQWAIKQRYAVLILFIAFATLGLGLMGTGKLKTVFLPDVPGQVITVSMEMDARAPYQLTLGNADRIESVAKQLNQELMESYQLSQKPIKDMLVFVAGAFSVSVYAELSPAADRPGLGTLDILSQWQERVGQLEGAMELTFSGSEEIGGGFALQLYSENEDALRQASQELMAYLHSIKGISNVRDSLKNGKPELRLVLKPEAQHLGFTNEMLAAQIGMNFGGAEAQRLQRDFQEVRVIVKNHKESRDTIGDLMQARVKADGGQWFPLLAVASIESTYATDFIARRNGKRVNSIRAHINKEIVSPTEVSQDLFANFVPEFKQRYPRVNIGLEGELEEIDMMKGGLIKALIFTCILIYALLAIPLKSYWQPFVIMSVIPFGFVGAALGHFIIGLPLSMLSFFGMLALTGVVVNDSLVLITRYNQNRDEGASLHEALTSAGIGRFKAIFLTTATTVAGLMPLISETSEQAQYLIPAAVSLAYGEIFATAITLILVPVLIAVAADVQHQCRQFYLARLGGSFV